MLSKAGDHGRSPRGEGGEGEGARKAGKGRGEPAKVSPEPKEDSTAERK